MSHAAEVAPYFGSLLDHLPLMVFVKRAADLRFVFVNKAAEQLMGHSREALLGKTDTDFFPAEQAAFFNARDREVLDSGELSVVEEPIDTPAGQRWLRTRKVALTGDDGTPRYLLGISADITEARAAGDALKSKSRALEEALAQLMALEPLAVTGQQARSFAADMLGTSQRGDQDGLAVIVRRFHDATAGAATDVTGTVDLNEVVNTVGHQRPVPTTVHLASAPLTCRGSRADAVQLTDALASYLLERCSGKVGLRAIVDDEAPRVRLTATGHLPTTERLRLLRPGAPLLEVSATVRARLAVARSAALRSGAQLFSRTDGEHVILDVVFEPLLTEDGVSEDGVTEHGVTEASSEEVAA